MSQDASTSTDIDSASSVSLNSEDETLHEMEEYHGLFAFFPKLPPELRRPIWRFAIPNGRIVDIVYDEEQDRYFSFHAQVPAILRKFCILE